MESAQPSLLRFNNRCGLNTKVEFLGLNRTHTI